MDKLSMKTVDIGLQTVGNAKASTQTTDVSDEFRKMLQGKNEDAVNSQSKTDSKEVSKDTKQEKTEASDDTKKDAVSKDEGTAEKSDKTEQTDKTKEDTRQAEEMLVAQLRERFTYGFTNVDSETETKTEVGTEVLADVVDMPAETNATGLEELVQPMAVEEQAAVQMQTQMPETGKVEPVQTTQVLEQNSAPAQDVTDVKAVETSVTPTEDSQEAGGQTQDFSSQLKNTAKSTQTGPKNQVQSENFAAEQGAVVTNEATKVVQQEEVRPENITTVHVAQPEELPEKVTDQLLAKLVEGVKEFEIHIEPASLGKIAVKVLYEGSQATISIICSEKRAMDVLGQNAREIGNIINRNLGGETTIIVDKQETDYLNQTRDENEQSGQNSQKQKEGNGKNQNGEDAEQFLQKLRLGLAG